MLLSSDKSLDYLKQQYPESKIRALMDDIYQRFKKEPVAYFVPVGVHLVSPLFYPSMILRKRLNQLGKDVSVVPEVSLTSVYASAALLASVFFYYVYQSGKFGSSMKVADKGYVYLGLLSALGLFLVSDKGSIYEIDDDLNTYLRGGVMRFYTDSFSKQCLSYMLENSPTEDCINFLKGFTSLSFEEQELIVRPFVQMVLSYFPFKGDPVVLQIVNR